MAKVKAAHHRGTHQVRAKRITDAAYADPSTRCWRCQRTLAEVPRHKSGMLPRWTAGHVIDGQVNGRLAAECSVCNFTEGARLGNARQHANRQPAHTPTIVSRTWQ